MVVGEIGQLARLARGQIAIPHIAHSALGVEIVKARAVLTPQWTATITFTHHERTKLACVKLVLPNLSCRGTNRSHSLAVELIAAPRE